MSTKILNAKDYPALQPSHGLWSFYKSEEAPYRFQAASIDDVHLWQAEVRDRLQQAIGFQDLPPTDLNPQLIETVDKGDYVREKWLLQTWKGALMPVYLLLPKDAPRPLPVVLAFHGHGYGVKDIVGLWEDGEERGTPDGYHRDFGVSLVKRGFAVACPEISCFGERQSDFSRLKLSADLTPDTCAHTSRLALHLGGSVLGLRVIDSRRLIDYVETRADLDAKRLGAMGISGGGTVSFFSTALDERIRACVVSGYFSTFQDSILAMYHCSCNYVPGMAQFGEMYDIAGLVAPRPMLVESGTHDAIYPVQAAKRAVEIARSQAYEIFGAADQLELDIYEGRHRISGVRAYDFLWEKLTDN